MGFMDKIKDFADKAPIYVGNIEYCGGIADFKKKCDININVNKYGIEFAYGFKKVSIDIDDVLKSELTTEEQISKDVTLTRLVLFGVFAFGLKKKKVDIKEYLVITYKINDFETKCILKGKNIDKINNAIIKAKQN